jgi:plasmid stabilization system protein ParE
MNPQILELADRAEDYADSIVDQGGEFHVAYTKKFAELLVRECADWVSQSVVRDKGHIPQDPHSQGWNAAVAYASRELKQHFGVGK